MTTAHTATPNRVFCACSNENRAKCLCGNAYISDEAIADFANNHAAVVENAYIGYTGEHIDHGAAYAIAEAMAPICAGTTHADLVKALQDATNMLSMRVTPEALKPFLDALAKASD